MTPDEMVRDTLEALLAKHNVLLSGPPGTGKTYLMERVRAAFIAGDRRPLLLDRDTDFFEELPIIDRACREAWWVTFHQSYAYEDFVLGLRTKPGAGFDLDPTAGPMLEAAENARLPDGASLLLIDEINRGNAPRALGEMITLMEGSKRLRPDGSRGPESISIRLPHIDATGLAMQLRRQCNGTTSNVTIQPDFMMPWHVYILASMNSVDKSVAPIDAAIRRRFYIVELEPDYALLTAHLKIDGDFEQLSTLAEAPQDLAYWRKLAVRVLHQLNYRIRSLVGADFELGHSYLLELAEEGDIEATKRSLASILSSKLVPQLVELFRGDPPLLAHVLQAAPSGEAPWYPYRIEDLTEGLEAIGGRASVRLRPIEPGQLEQILRRLGDVNRP